MDVCSKKKNNISHVKSTHGKNWYTMVCSKKKNKINKIFFHGPFPAFNSVREGPLGTISTISNKRTQPCRTKVA